MPWGDPHDDKMLLRGLFGRGRVVGASAAESVPGDVDVLLDRAQGRLDSGDAAQAVLLLEQAVSLRPSEANNWYRLGVACFEAGSSDRAEASYRRSLELDPHHAKALCNLGMIRQRNGLYADAEQHYCRAVESDPDLAQAWFNLGILRFNLGRKAEAREPLERAAALDPGRADRHAALGSAYQAIGRPLDARASLARALALDPGLAIAHEHLACCLLEMGEPESAAAEFRRAHECDPGMHTAASNALFALNYADGVKPEAIFQEHLRWARQYAQIPTAASYANDPHPERRLRIAYLSPDLRRHSVGYFVEGVFASHDRTQVEVLCYSDAETEDDVSGRLRRHVDHWRRTSTLDDAHLDELIRGDRVDLLVDLAGHSAGGRRMPVLAHKPAPLQLTWLGYLNTTGLGTMDYRITDAHACPAGWERYHTEQLIRLPDSQWCYTPDADAPAVAAPPSENAAGITFGSVHNLAKITDRVLRVWARLLRELHGARLVMIVPGARQFGAHIADRFRRAGADPRCVECIEPLPILPYLAAHARIDINLDAFPHAGGTTTCHSLWMGVPVVTLAGDTMASRGGASLLHAVGLQDLVAASEDEYVSIAAGLARDTEQLGKLRRELRERMARSPLMDAARFTRTLEDEYRKAWRGWCARSAVRH